MFWTSRIWIRHFCVRIRIQILPSTSKQVRETLISTILWLLFWRFIYRTDVNVPSKSIKQKSFGKNFRIRKTVVAWIQISPKMSRIRKTVVAWIRISPKMSRIHDTAKNSRKRVSLIFAESNCNGSALDRFENNFPCSRHSKYKKKCTLNGLIEIAASANYFATCM